MLTVGGRRKSFRPDGKRVRVQNTICKLEEKKKEIYMKRILIDKYD